MSAVLFTPITNNLGRLNRSHIGLPFTRELDLSHAMRFIHNDKHFINDFLDDNKVINKNKIK